MSTIFALATAPGKAGVSVIRISGPGAFLACERLTGWHPDAREFRLLALRDPDGSIVDRSLVLAFLPGQSFTGEACVEFQVHGSPAICARVLSLLGEIEGLRPAEAGEFTRRALENDKLDLVQVEGLGDLIEAETELQRRQAMSVFEGSVADKLANWRQKLLRSIALIEATIDFADEDVPVDVEPEVLADLGVVLSEMAAELAGVPIAERVRDGFEVAIVGQPNAGKSTLLNRLAGRDLAIISEIAGTTRDIIEAKLDLDGLPVTFLDTAGMRDTLDQIEAIGVDRAISRANGADLRVFLQVQDNESWPVPVLDGDLILQAKSDQEHSGQLGVSGRTGVGVAEMLEYVRRVLLSRVSQVETMTRQRHANCLKDALLFLRQARDSVSSGSAGYEIVAEDLRSALRVLEQILGHVGVEDILGEIFSSFCIGK